VSKFNWFAELTAKCNPSRDRRGVLNQAFIE